MTSDSDRQQTTNLKQMTDGNGLVRVGNILSAGGAGAGLLLLCMWTYISPAGNCASPNAINMIGEEEAGTGHGKIRANY